MSLESTVECLNVKAEADSPAASRLSMAECFHFGSSNFLPDNFNLPDLALLNRPRRAFIKRAPRALA